MSATLASLCQPTHSAREGGNGDIVTYVTDRTQFDEGLIVPFNGASSICKKNIVLFLT